MAQNRIRTDKNSKVTEAQVQVFLIEEGDFIVSYCPALELSSFGKTESEARDCFEEALHEFIEEVESRGTLEKILLDLGWELKKIPTPSYKPPKLIASQMKRFAAFKVSNKKIYNEKVLLPL